MGPAVEARRALAARPARAFFRPRPLPDTGRGSERISGRVSGSFKSWRGMRVQPWLAHRVPVPTWFPVARIENANHDPFGALHVDVQPQMLTGECGVSTHGRHCTAVDDDHARRDRDPGVWLGGAFHADLEPSGLPCGARRRRSARDGHRRIAASAGLSAVAAPLAFVPRARTRQRLPLRPPRFPAEAGALTVAVMICSLQLSDGWIASALNCLARSSQPGSRPECS